MNYNVDNLDDIINNIELYHISKTKQYSYSSMLREMLTHYNYLHIQFLFMMRRHNFLEDLKLTNVFSLPDDSIFDSIKFCGLPTSEWFGS